MFFNKLVRQLRQSHFEDCLDFIQELFMSRVNNFVELYLIVAFCPHEFVFE